MVLLAPYSLCTIVLIAFGWILIATTTVMALIPWDVHRRFAEASVPKALRFLPMIGVASLSVGSLLLWAVLTAKISDSDRLDLHRDRQDLPLR